MRLLVLGGTWFLGRTLVEHALARGWEVATFTRGHSGSAVPGATAMHGDRSVLGDLAQLVDAGPWEAVVDTSGHEPATVLAAARALEPHAGRYVYVSTVNVYQGWPTEPLDDDSPVTPSSADRRAANQADAEGIGTAATYGEMKSGCEQAAVAAFGSDRTLLLRPGVLLGPYEYVGRLPWLLRRMERGGRVLAAGDPDRPIQPLDVRDLAAFILHTIETGENGAMNATAPTGHATYGELMRACQQVTGGQAELTWVSDDWLSRQEVEPWTEIPLWRTVPGAWAVTSTRAHAAGLHARPLTETVADTWAWLQGEALMPHVRQDEIGIDAEKESALLAAWDRDAVQAN